MNRDNTDITQTKKSIKPVVLGILILLLQIGILFAYGFAGQFTTTFNDSQPLILPIYFYMTLFAVGMGLMLSFYGKGTAIGLGTAIFALALNIQLSPLLQKFWYNVFINHFVPYTQTNSSSDFFMITQQLSKIKLTSYIERNAAAMTISYLISCLGFVGRAGLFQTFISLIAYNIVWPVPLYCNIKIYMNDMGLSAVAFDDYGLTFIYTFAAFFGVAFGLFLNCRKQQNLQNSIPSKSSLVFTIFGSTLVFCTLPLSGFLYPLTTSANKINIGVLNMYFAQIASVIACIVFSLLIGKGRLRVQNVIVSVLSGPAIAGQFAGLITTISGFLALGAIGGLVCAIWTQLIHPSINKNSIKDSMSLIGGVLLPSLFGGIVATPVLYRILIDNDWSKNISVSGTSFPNFTQYIRHNYIYYFITVGAALVAGIVAGIFSLCTKQNENDFTNNKFFSHDFGLCNNPAELENQEKQYQTERRQETAQQLNKEV